MGYSEDFRADSQGRFYMILEKEIHYIYAHFLLVVAKARYI